jgi:hypothetical protein
MSRIVFLIMAHQLPDQFGRLVRRLEGEDRRIIAHIDARSDLAPFEHASRGTSVEFLRRRHRVVWGGWRIVAGHLALVRAALDEDFDHAVLLSGQCYPIRPLRELHEHFDRATSVEHIDGFVTPETQPSKIGRLSRVHLVDLFGLLPPWVPGGRMLRRALRRLPERRIPFGLDLRGGEAWWALSRPTLERIMGLLRRRPHIRWYFATTRFPDEHAMSMLVHSLVPHELIRETMTYTRWAEVARHPEVLTKDDLADLDSSEAFFARKFDVRVCTDVLDRLDEREHAPPAA